MSFGQYLRAFRQMYHWSDRHRAFIRMRAVGPSTFLVEVAPMGSVVADSGREKHVWTIWWDGKDKGRALLDMCGPLRQIADAVERGGEALPGRRVYFVGEDGELLTADKLMAEGE